MLSEFNGHHCQHRSDDFPLIASVLQHRRPMVVIELGTDEGGFAGFLANTVAVWGGRVYTYDIKCKFDPRLLDEHLNLYFVLGDVLTDAIMVTAIRNALRNPRCLIYCDNGNKPEELRLYAPHVSRGSLVGVHDYGTEVAPGWAESFMLMAGYAQERHVEFAALANEWYTHSLTRFWVRQ